MRDDLTARTLPLRGYDRDEIEAYAASPAGDGDRGAVVFIHHLPGYDLASKEVVRRFAALGYDAVMPNLFHREAPGADPDDAAATARANGGAPDERVVGDVAGAIEYLKALPHSNGKVGVIGHCSGGRQTVLSACSLKLDAAVDCYGAFVTRSAPADFAVPMTSLEDRLADLSCPLLGLFGADDTHPSPEDTADLERRLKELGKSFTQKTYDGAGHAFFSVDRPSYRPEAAVDGWQRIADFFGQHLNAVPESAE